MQKFFNMNLKLIFIIVRILYTVKGEGEESLPAQECQANEKVSDGKDLVNKLLTELNTVLVKNRQISQNFIDLEKRQETLENFTKQFTKDIKRFLNKSLDIKSLNQNRDWTVIQRRKDGSIDFYRNWAEYKRGFGHPNGEFAMGLEKLHAMTTYGAPQELLIILKDFDNNTRYAKYDNFIIGSELEKYFVKETGKYSGDAGDSFSKHKGLKFTTKDQDNDNHGKNCAEKYKGAWWFDKCYVHKCHLNGPYFQNPKSNNSGIIWMEWLGGHYSLKSVEMMIRRKK